MGIGDKWIILIFQPSLPKSRIQTSTSSIWLQWNEVSSIFLSSPFVSGLHNIFLAAHTLIKAHILVNAIFILERDKSDV